MSIKIFSDQQLLYDSCLPSDAHYSLLSVHIQDALNKAGLATLALPPEHPQYQAVTAFSSCITIYRGSQLIWRGRALPSSDDFWRVRTIPCEGEMCFLQDSVFRPYSGKHTPGYWLAMLIAHHNTHVDSWKRFSRGTVTVSAGAVELAVKDPATTFDVLQKLLEIGGGYIIFDGPADDRRINWYETLPKNTCNQSIRLGENLLEPLMYTPNIDGFATRIIPYGATGSDGIRLQLPESGDDHVDNLDAQKKYGIIEKAIIYDEITDPQVLRERALQDVQFCGSIPETLELSAADLSCTDESLDAFAVGQMIPVESDFHGLDGTFTIVAIDTDLLQPELGSITLARDAMYYTGPQTLSGSIKKEIESKVDITNAGMQDAIAAATAWLTNGQGYKVERRDPATGQVIDTLYLDQPDINTAVNVLRVGQSGIGFSGNGVNGPYTSAWTLDGKFNASFILTGVLTANLIKAGVLADEKENFKLDLATGFLNWKKGAINLGEGNFTVTDMGELTAKMGKIAGFNIQGESLVGSGIAVNPGSIALRHGNSDTLTLQALIKTDGDGAVVDLPYGNDFLSFSAGDYTGAFREYLVYAARAMEGMEGQTLHCFCDVNGHDFLAKSVWLDPETGGANGGLSGTYYLQDGTAMRFKNGLLVG